MTVPRRIVIVVGHPDPDPARLCRALAASYRRGAERAGHQVRLLDIAALEVPFLRSAEEFESGAAPGILADAVDSIRWAEHIVIIFPLWLGTMPALLKAFLEQVMRPSVAFDYPQGGKGFAKPRLKGRSARVVVTMGMPAFVYRLWFFGHGVAGMRRNILKFVGISPVRETLYGLALSTEGRRAGWHRKMERLGAAAR